MHYAITDQSKVHILFDLVLISKILLEIAQKLTVSYRDHCPLLAYFEKNTG